MADNNRISIKKTSRVLAITCVAYTTVATILYNNPLAELSQCILDSSNGSIINVI